MKNLKINNRNLNRHEEGTASVASEVLHEVDRQHLEGITKIWVAAKGNGLIQIILSAKRASGSSISYLNAITHSLERHLKPSSLTELYGTW